jgi:hypothetical protein
VGTKSSFDGSEVCLCGDFWVVTPCSSEKARENSAYRLLSTDFLPGLLFHPEDVGVVLLIYVELCPNYTASQPTRQSSL